MKKLFLLSVSCFVVAVANNSASSNARAETVRHHKVYHNHRGYHNRIIAERRAKKMRRVKKERLFHACDHIVNECKRLGFVVGEYKQGNGLWRDCVNPVLAGQPATQRGKIVLVPANRKEITACAQQRGRQRLSKF